MGKIGGSSRSTEKGQRGTNIATDGAKRGMPGLVRDNSKIDNDVFSTMWASPLNANNGPDPFVDSKGVGGIVEAHDLESPSNPMGFGNVVEGGGSKTGRRG